MLRGLLATASRSGRDRPAATPAPVEDVFRAGEKPRLVGATDDFAGPVVPRFPVNVNAVLGRDAIDPRRGFGQRRVRLHARLPVVHGRVGGMGAAVLAPRPRGAHRDGVAGTEDYRIIANCEWVSKRPARAKRPHEAVRSAWYDA